MSPLPHLPLADPFRDMPSCLAARMDRIHAALATLRSEIRRLERLGFERPLTACADALRFWMFLDGLHAAAVLEACPTTRTGGPAWRRVVEA